MEIRLSDHFTYGRLFKFVIPTITMMIIGSIYGIVDGYFISNYVGKEAFSAVNFIMPVIIAMASAGFMIGTGGSAFVAKTLGEGKKEKANNIFSMLIYVLIIFSILISIVGIIFMRDLAKLIGADDLMIDNCVLYGRTLLIGNTAFMLQNCFQSFLIVAEKPKMGLLLSICGGVTNIILDFLFVAIFKWGLVGAAVATMIGQVIAGVIPLVYFLRKNNSLLQMIPPLKVKFDSKALFKSCSNGASEMVTLLSSSLVGILYNYQLMKFAGMDGISAYGVIMYVNFVFIGFFIGFATGNSPIVSYNYGSGNTKELKNLFKKSLIIISIASIVMITMAQILASPLAKIFVGYDAELFKLTKTAFKFYSISFLICGFNIFSSAFFTSLNNGLISAIISFLRTFFLQTAAIFILPILFGINGIWIAIAVAEAITLIFTIIFFITQRKKYRYI